MDVDGYRHNYKGFLSKFHISNVDTTRGWTHKQLLELHLNLANMDSNIYYMIGTSVLDASMFGCPIQYIIVHLMFFYQSFARLINIRSQNLSNLGFTLDKISNDSKNIQNE